MASIKKNLVLLLQGELSLVRAVVIGVVCFMVWTLLYLLIMGVVHGEWLDEIIIDSFLNKHDGRWFYYELVSTTLLFPCYFLILCGVWRCTNNTSRKYAATISKIAIILFSLLLLLLYAMLMIGTFFFGPPAL